MFSFQVNCRYVSVFLLIKHGKLQCCEKVFAPFLITFIGSDQTNFNVKDDLSK